ncbi:c-type cytochrome [Crateriforma conspicua]|uniref:Cytochrome c n=1 Tax=Crateriforma conspicua TaxID=2527996 RepID=A0A5C5YFY7_9PLAN|nr:c-type cytochrome [Crateriforma conspicua]TWT72152.1 Cytochrome c [Crateriforma conspicua]
MPAPPTFRSIAFTLTGFLCLIPLSLQSNAGGLGVTPPDQIRVTDGFAVELVYEVPGKGGSDADGQGSWVSLTVDPQGRLIACDQYGALYRIDVSGDAADVEKLDIEFAGAQGLLCAFGSLYANVNSRDFPSGVWRLTDTDGDDQYDKKEHILPLNGGSEHGPHAMVLTPDGKRIVTCAGNNTNLPDDFAISRVPEVWDEDHLLGRMPDARGHNANRMAPGGFVIAFDPDGGNRELIATGFRNHYDIAFNTDGELFTYDADMEWDVGTPWYRPTRVNHVISGAEFGWRNGTGKWPAYYPDSFGAAVDIGPGSPTGIAFGYDSGFPQQYRNALYIADWSYGNIHAVFLRPDGATYSGEFVTFATGAPLPVTDIAFHPGDGAMYFTIGGRRAQSGLYRIRYVGDEDDSAAPKSDDTAKDLRQLRHRIEKLHTGQPTDVALNLAVRNLGHDDRAIRFASRIALEHHDVAQWIDAALKSKNDRAVIQAAVAIARVGTPDHRGQVLAALGDIDVDALDDQSVIDLTRAYALTFLRLNAGDQVATPSDAQRQQIVDQLNDRFPSGKDNLDRELARLLVFVNADGIVPRVIAQLNDAPSQESQIHYAMILRHRIGDAPAKVQRDYFSWFNRMRDARGGMSFGGFVKNIQDAAAEGLTDDDRQTLASVLNPPVKSDAVAEEARPLVKQWSVDDLAEHVASPGRAFDFQRGKEMFVAAQCYKCHRMGLEGGILGPDLTGAGGRFSVTDLLSSIIEPGKVISDQYGATQFLTDDGRVVVGRVINLNGNKLSVMTNMLDPSSLTSIDRDTIEETAPARNSMMPSGLVDTLNEDEIADLVAYLRAGGRSDHALYAKVSGADASAD